MYKSIPCIWMRGGTSKGAYFLAEDLPENPDERNALLLRVMGSPDPRQIDGIGGADPLTSKVAIVQPSQREGVDVDYLFLQVFVDKAVVSDAQNCGNILAGIGPFAVERGLVTVTGDQTSVAIYMENTGQTATELVQTPEGKVQYAGDARIDGVPGSSSAIPITFKDTAGSTCGSLLPTGNTTDIIDGVKVTCIDNGMPVVVLATKDFGITGKESREELDQNEPLKTRLESVRLQAGRMMNLGDVTYKSVPKMSLVSEAAEGLISTRTFIPHRCHASIGVLGAVSVATACMLLGSPANKIANVPDGNRKIMSVEHPIGEMTVIMEMDDEGALSNCAILRTARKLFEGLVFVD
jgi:4-oxalomesaconate tautomerase